MTTFRGKPVVLSLAYDTCPMLCSLSAAGAGEQPARRINLDAGNDFDVVTMSFDPRDTPQRSREKKKTAVPRLRPRGREQGWHF